MNKIIFILFAQIVFLNSINCLGSPRIIFEMNDKSRHELELNTINNIVFVPMLQVFNVFVFTNKTEPLIFANTIIDSISFDEEKGIIKNIIFNIGRTKEKIELSMIDSIIFRLHDIKISPNVIPLQNLNPKSLKSVQSDKLIFDNTTVRKDSLLPGNIIVEGITKNLPAGLIRKVISLNLNGDELEVNTSIPKLVEAIEEGTGMTSRKISIKDTTGLVCKKGVKLDRILTDEFKFSIDDFIIYEQGSLKITANGSFSISPDIFFDIYIKDFSLNRFYCRFALNEKMNIEVNGNVSAKFEKIKELANWDIKPITILIGWFPLVITSKLVLEIGANGELSLGVSTGISQESNSVVGVKYLGGKWNTIEEYSNTFDFREPAVTDANASAKVFLGPKFIVSMYDMDDYFNSYAYLRGYLGLDIDLLADTCLTLKAGIEANAGIAAPFLGDEADFSFPEPYDYSTNLYNLRCGLNIDSITPNPVCPGSIVTIRGKGFGNNQDNSIVSINGIGVRDIVTWSPEEISIIVPKDANKGTLSLEINAKESNKINFDINGCKYELINIGQVFTTSLFQQPILSKDGKSVLYTEGFCLNNSDGQDTVQLWLANIDEIQKGGKAKLVYEHKDKNAFIEIFSASDDNQHVIVHSLEGEVLINTSTQNKTILKQPERQIEVDGETNSFYLGSQYSLSPNGNDFFAPTYAPWGIKFDELELSFIETINPEHYWCIWTCSRHDRIGDFDEPKFRSRTPAIWMGTTYSLIELLNISKNSDAILGSRIYSDYIAIYRSNGNIIDSVFSIPYPEHQERKIVSSGDGKRIINAVSNTEIAAYRESGEEIKLTVLDDLPATIQDFSKPDYNGDNFLVWTLSNIYRVKTDDSQALPLINPDDYPGYYINATSGSISDDGETAAFYFVKVDDKTDEAKAYIYVAKGISHK